MRSVKIWCSVGVVVSVMVSGPVMADGFGCPASLSPVKMDACLQTRDAILTRELAVARKEKALREMGDVGARHLSLPQVESTYGTLGHLEAVLHWHGGSSLAVSRGDVIPGGYRIVVIAPGRVSVAGRDGEKHVLLMEGGSDGGEGSAYRKGSPATPSDLISTPERPAMPALHGASIHG